MTKREWRIAIPILVGLALCVAGFLRGLDIDKSFVGMSAMRAMPDGKLAVVANHALHVLDPAGRRVARQPLKALGMVEDPNDMDWTVDGQGRIEAWFFDDSVPRVVRCGWDADRQQLGQCAAAMSGPHLKANPVSRAVHLAVDRAGERIFIADANGQRVQVFDLAGKRITSSVPATLPLYFPNRLRYLGNDTLAIADNDHHRVVWARSTPGKAPELLRALDASAHPQARSSRNKVTDMAFGPQGALWMIAMRQGQKDGDVLVFDGDRPVARAELPPGADPIVIESLGEAAVAADYSLVELYRLDDRGKYLGPFGDKAFTAEMAPLKALSREVAWWTNGSLAAGGLVIALGLLLAWRYGEKPAWRGDGPPAVRADLGGDGALKFPVVLPQTAAYLAAMRRMALGLGVVVVLMLAALAVLALNVKPGLVIYLQLGSGMVATIAMAWLTFRDLLHPRELRITANRVGLFRRGKLLAEAVLSDVYASRKALLIGRTYLVYHLGSAQLGKIPPMFDAALLERALLARLPAANMLDDRRMQTAMLKRQPALIALVAATFAATAWIAYRTLWG
ncbi:MAG: hypothetical protein Q8R01_07130 [Ramlibacter sp.]|nr:hypothetical protein [Ramlibacter sp.]